MLEENNESQESEVVETQDQESNQTLIDSSENAAYYLMEGIAGTGDAPEWFLNEKYKSVAEQAKAYNELNKKFGSFTGAPKDGYSLPEGLAADDELVKKVMEFGTKSQLNQDGFSELLDLALTQADASQQVDRENELKKLGDNAGQRIKQLEVFLADKFGDSFDSVKEKIVDANSVMLAEMMMKAMQPAKLPIDGVEVEGKPTWSDIEVELFRKDENGNLLMSVDMNHRNKVERMKREYGGDRPNRSVIG